MTPTEVAGYKILRLWFYIGILLFILLHGEPDLLDALVSRIACLP